MKDKELISHIISSILAGVIVNEYISSKENVNALVLRQICRAMKAYLEMNIKKEYDPTLSMKLDHIEKMLDLIGEIKENIIKEEG